MAGEKGPEGEAPKPDQLRTEAPSGDKEPADTRESGTEPEPEPSEESSALVVIGIGASAGGLEALTELIREAPADGMAFLVVQHLAPHYESMLPQLLARSSRLEVVAAADGMPVEANRIYVIPPNADLAVMQRVIRLVPPPEGMRLPIDYLFRSLADDFGASAIGVVLSGTGSDGTFGLKAIKAAGGLTFVQDPKTAKYDGMPRSAIASGAADFVLSPQEIGVELARAATRPRIRRTQRIPVVPQALDQLGKLFLMIRNEYGTDLSQYKQSTIERRIERRMTLHRLGRLDDYLRLVQTDRAELRALYDDMLITVTSFFRDPETFAALKTTVIPQIFEQKHGNGPVRVWVPACATGEEAYSIAICLLEYCEEHSLEPRVQMFGTDIDEDSVQHARRGVYPANIAQDVTPDRLNRFFVQKDGDYHITRRVRDMLVFSRQNVLRDAPFSRMDLVSCRNLLIYLQPAAQKKVLRVLHYALNPNGFLVLGSSETVGDAPELFATVDRKFKIYSKQNIPGQIPNEVGFGVAQAVDVPMAAAAPRPQVNLQGLVDRKVLELFGPAGVVVNEQLEIMQFRGHTGPYLDPAPGTASFNLLRVARFELHIELKRAIEQALATRQRVTTEVTYGVDHKQHVVQIDVVPMQDPETKTRCMLVTFHALPPPREIPVVNAGDGQTGETVLPLAQRIQDLERELASTKEYLQATMEERESTLEELKSANEELQSSNEELQSTNEELETSKEEMQSTNEELTTVNEELQNRMAELSQINDDLFNVLSGVDNAVVIVGLDLRIRRYTRSAERLFNLVPADVGRSIGFLDRFFGDALEPKVTAVIQNLSTLEQEVLAQNQRWYLLRINPYKTLDHSIRGALLTLIDIDVRKRAAVITQDVGAYADRVLAPIGHPLLIVDRKQRVVWTNDRFLSMFQLTREEVVGSELAEIGSRLFADKGLHDQLEHLFVNDRPFRDYMVRFRSAEGEQVLHVGASQVTASGETPLALVAFEPLLRRESAR